MPRNGLWRDTYYVTAYELARTGQTEKSIAKTLGVSQQAFNAWKAKRPALRDALVRGRTNHNAIVNGTTANATFREYLYRQLDPALQDTWDEINRCDCSQVTNHVQRIEALMTRQGKRGQQHLFLHALVCSNFNASEACRKTCTPRQTYTQWLGDPDFALLVDEMHWHKKNFFEGGLVALVAAGDSPATIFANKTFNRDRGYGEKIELTGAIEVTSTQPVDLGDLDLPLEVRKVILDALRAKQPKLIEAVYAEEGASGD